jgi:hypothetical protein
MQIITNEILRSFGKVDSIMLAGGFGRGEGSIKFLSNGEIRPLKDYDLFVITENNISPRGYSSLMDAIYAKLGIDSLARLSAAPGSFSITLQIIPKKKLDRLPPDISTIDLKLASKIIYGEDLRTKIAPKVDDIVLASGAIVLLNKVTALLEILGPTLMNEHLDAEIKESIIYDCGKTFMEICTALSIIKKKYVPSYKQRSIQFQKMYIEEFPQLLNKLPELPDNVKFFTELKLSSNLRYEGDVKSLVFSARRNLEVILKFYMSYFLRLNKEIQLDWGPLADKMYEKMGYMFFKEYLDFNLRKMGKCYHILLPFINVMGQIYDNIHFSRQVKLYKGVLYYKSPLHWRSPIIKIFIASILTLFSLQEDGSIDRFLMKKGFHYLSQAFPCNRRISSLNDDWDYLRKSCVEAQKFYFRTQVKSVI